MGCSSWPSTRLTRCWSWPRRDRDRHPDGPARGPGRRGARGRLRGVLPEAARADGARVPGAGGAGPAVGSVPGRRHVLPAPRRGTAVAAQLAVRRDRPRPRGRAHLPQRLRPRQSVGARRRRWRAAARSSTSAVTCSTSPWASSASCRSRRCRPTCLPRAGRCTTTDRGRGPGAGPAAPGRRARHPARLLLVAARRQRRGDRGHAARGGAGPAGGATSTAPSTTSRRCCSTAPEPSGSSGRPTSGAAGRSCAWAAGLAEGVASIPAWSAWCRWPS